MRVFCLLPMLVVLATSTMSADDDVDGSKIIRKIELLGGNVKRDDKSPGRPVIGVDLEGSKRFTDGHLHLLRAFKQMTNLNLRATRITDQGANEIGKLTNLSTLSLADTSITDEGLKEIRQLELLTSLNLNNTRITDNGLMELRDLKNLNTLRLGQTVSTDAGEQELLKLIPGLRIRRNSGPLAEETKQFGRPRIRPMDLIKNR